MGLIDVRRSGLPRCPPDIAEEVELYARESGRTATVHFVPFGGWFARFSLRPNDPKLRAFREGRAAEPATEDVWFQVPNPRFGGQDERGSAKRPFIPLDIAQLGRSGVREFLERGNTWSGRGAYASHEAALQSAAEQNTQNEQRLRRETLDRARDKARDERRARLGIPFLRVGADIAEQKPESQ